MALGSSEDVERLSFDLHSLARASQPYDYGCPSKNILRASLRESDEMLPADHRNLLKYRRLLAVSLDCYGLARNYCF